MSINCGACGIPLYSINEACPNCLPTMADRPPTFTCPSCAALRARVEVLEKAVEWALNEGCATAQNEGWDAYEAELRRRAKEG